MPTLIYWERFTDLALPVWHWPFLAQPAPLPERLIGADPRWFADHLLKSWTLEKSLACFAPEALESYRAQMASPERLAAMCADYRAGAGPDREQDAKDRAAGRRIAAPLHFLWARSGFPARSGDDPAAVWRQWAGEVSDSPCNSGHFAMEENPQAVLAAFLPHFGAG